MFHRIKQLRKEKGLLQSEVAEYLNVNQTTYSCYEIGTRKIHTDILLKLADLYQVSTDYLLGKTELRYTQHELDFFNELKEKDIDQLIREYNLTLGDEAMDDKDERILIKLIKSFMEEKD